MQIGATLGGTVGIRGRMKVVACPNGQAVIDRIIRHLKLAFVAEKPPSC